MRSIKFRGFTKELVKNEWVYGNLIKRDNGECIIINDDFRIWDISHDGFQVEPETIGQFTGLYDKNGYELFEGDIITFNHNEEYIKGKIVFKDLAYQIQSIPSVFQRIFSWSGRHIEIIGNIHENKNLLEQ